jgi:hypothetical protein
VVGNVVGSRAPDVVSTSGDTVQVWANPGGFDLGAPIDTRANLSGANKILAVGDWDRDGFGDVVVRQSVTGNLVLWRGDGHGHLARSGVLAKSFGTVAKLAAVGDMTGDGFPDLIGQPRHGVLTLYPGRGLAGLRTGYPAHSALGTGTPIGVGRWNADGAPDSLVRHGASLSLYPGNGPGGLSSPRKLPIDLTPYDWVIGVSDIRLTGHPDLIVRAKGSGRIYVLPGTSNGFGTRIYLGSGLGGYDLAG